MTTDGAGDPLLAYGWLSPADASKKGLWFTRWDHEAGTFTSPVVIDATVDDGVGTAQPFRQAALARDATTGKLAVAYVVQDTPVNPNNPPRRVFLRTSTDSGATWSERVQLSEDAADDHAQASGPSIAMTDGKVYVAFVQDGQTVCDDSGGDCGVGAGVWFLEGDGATFSKRTALLGAFGVQSSMPGLTSMALDGKGAPGLAWLSDARQGYDRKVLFWHHGDAQVKKVFDSAGTQNDDPSVALAYDGDKPRVLSTLAIGAETAGAYVAKSDDGATWSAPIALPQNGDRDRSWWTALALDGAGAAYGLTFSNGGGNLDYCGEGPQLFTSSDLATWNVCGLDATKAYPNINGAFSQAYVTAGGKLTAAGLGSLGGPDSDGIWIYRAP